MRILPAPFRGCPTCCHRSASRRPRPATLRRGPLLTESGRAEGTSHSSHAAAISRRRDEDPTFRRAHEHSIDVETLRPSTR